MLLPFFKWLESLAFGESAIGSIAWFGAMINILHLLSLPVFFGAVLIVDLRLLGRGLTREPLAQVAEAAQPWLIGGLVAMAATGIPQVVLTPMREYNSDVFWLKMQTLLVATIYTFTIRRNITLADEQRLGPLWGKVAAIVSIALWAGVVVPGRLIGLLT